MIAIFSIEQKFKQMTVKDLEIVKALNIRFVPVEKEIPKVVAWKKLRRGGLKLNIDGSSFCNPGLVGGEGIFRDDKGLNSGWFCNALWCDFEYSG